MDWSSAADSMVTSFPGSYTHRFFSSGDSLKIGSSYHLHLQMSLSSELELLPVALAEVTPEMLRSVGKILSTGGTSAALSMEVTPNHNYQR
jgi:hypothetical protein